MGQESFSFSGSGPERAKPERSEPTAAELRRTARSGGSRGRGPDAAAPPDAARPDAESTSASAEEAPAYTVSQLTREIESRLSTLGRVRVEGEVASLRRASSGHVYFDLKEEGALISCVVWRGQAQRALRGKLEEGMQVLARGKLDVYAPHGRYKLIVDRVEPLGIGALLAKLEELKAELAQVGRLDRHRPLPRFPRRIGVVTSRDGAALRDFLRTRSLRWPLYPVRLAHTLVQGPGAAEEIAAAIGRMDRSGVDVIVVTRGGGALQDLWCFNERIVADAIWSSSVPVVSAVGHESDTSLSDLVADFRAHTPTDAAQTVIPDRAAVLERIARAGNRLVEAVHDELGDRERRLAAVARSRGLSDPAAMLRDRAAALSDARSRLELSVRTRLERARGRVHAASSAVERHSPRLRLARALSRLDVLGEKLFGSAARHLAGAGQRIELAARSLESISPLAVLGRGYSITSRASASDREGGVLTDAALLCEGDLLETRLSRGSVVSRTVEVRPAEDADGAAR